jgi:threonine/homoserine/homoserine lactone efflux protein
MVSNNKWPARDPRRSQEPRQDRCLVAVGHKHADALRDPVATGNRVLELLSGPWSVVRHVPIGCRQPSMVQRVSLAFLLTAFVVVATPGTGALYTIAAGISRGTRASMVAAAGCTLGIVPHLVAAITGTAALLRASGTAFEAVKLLGVAYLLYMAWGTWRDKGLLVVEDSSPRTRSTISVIRSAVLINLLNPKLTIFFFAFLPQFVPRHSPHALVALLALSAVFMVMTFVVFAGYGVLASTARGSLVGRPRVVAGIRRLFAASFVALSAKLATTARA